MTTELLQPEPAQALGALLGVPVPDLDAGLPLLWHWVYLLDRPAQADLGPDGHPLRAAPAPGMRRMWAGGRVRTHGTLRCGEPATKRTQVLSVQEKQGRSGPLTFVVVGHLITQRGQVVVDEQQDIVYRQRHSGPPENTPQEVPAGKDEWSIDITPTLLFRFSALTYNAHRIHYDRDYARDIEGYPGLLTHGPLQALAMAEAARALGVRGDLLFEYRLTAPLFDHQGMIVRAARDGDTIATAVRDVYGRVTGSGVVSVYRD
ncbi:FAS1-like dehydratase domain-containing protein [Actinocrispum wychmicini]|uniref:3-methylfumaryl-CoA hydratase n=1 Tax=Actinocrispum wychmicini TaxID=1213861 RepID=A0A4R2IMY0_9PSEU|nr:MaoC family dehydratase N-terminal domain-containing protein [Actinocrispum wychmicini]TCO45369.1 3-methylfumaryl-CoA hydratase [Actinocrispum wychmicini]